MDLNPIRGVTVAVVQTAVIFGKEFGNYQRSARGRNNQQCNTEYYQAEEAGFKFHHEFTGTFTIINHFRIAESRTNCQSPRVVWGVQYDFKLSCDQHQPVAPLNRRRPLHL
jgi:hypothetical protein